MIEAYPLCWPVEYPRSTSRKDSRFTITLGQARDLVKEEVRRIGGKNPIISTNIPLKNDGDLRADWNRYKIDDPGVAVYFEYNGNPVCLCADHYKRVWENLKAVGRTIEALRQIDRDGVSDFLNRAFTGFKALPAAGETSLGDYWAILGIEPTKDLDKISAAYKKKAKLYHPDTGGDKDKWDELRLAYEKAWTYKHQ